MSEKGLPESRSSSGTELTPFGWLSTSTALERELPRSSTSETLTGWCSLTRESEMRGRSGESVSSSAASLKGARSMPFLASSRMNPRVTG